MMGAPLYQFLGAFILFINASLLIILLSLIPPTNGWILRTHHQYHYRNHPSSALFGKGFAKSQGPKTAVKKKEEKDSSVGSNNDSSDHNHPSATFYSMPALYDLAVAYRNYEEEVDFLLDAHRRHAGIPARSVLELAAGPGRHGILALESGTSVSRATCMDLSKEMAEYAQTIAQEILTDKNSMENNFEYLVQDMRNFELDHSIDTAWILAGSLQHMQTNADVLDCFRSVYQCLTPATGTLILELPHPKETFTMVDCTRNSWTVPLADDNHVDSGELEIVWGDDRDLFDPITQIRRMTLSMELKQPKNSDGVVDPAITTPEGMRNVREVVPMRMFTSQEIDALATSVGFTRVAQYGALEPDVSVHDEDVAYRLVVVLQKK